MKAEGPANIGGTFLLIVDGPLPALGLTDIAVLSIVYPDLSLAGSGAIAAKSQRSLSMNNNEQYLKLLSVFHYVVGGLAAFFSSFFLIHLSIGVAIIAGAVPDHPPKFVGLLLVMIALFAIASGWTLATCIIIAGRNLAMRRHYMFCLVMAAISCIFMPFGTVLGVFTIIVLLRPSVKELFAVNTAE